MNAIIVSIGDELANGQTVDTNSAYLARELAMRGIAAIEHITVGDDQGAIAAVLRSAAGRADVLIVTGGLGPTADDLTRQALADAMGVGLALDEASLTDIEGFFRRMGRVMIDANRIQAMVPIGAAAIRNEVGTAPGLYARLGRCEVFITPGVPSEMRWMFQNAIAPRLGSQGGVILHRILHTFGEGEGNVGATIEDLMRRGGNPTVGTTVAAGMVSIRVVARAENLEAAQAASEATVQELRRRLGALVIAEGDVTMAAAVGELLRSKGATLATAESCTGGMLGEMLTSMPGSSDYYVGGVVSYANQAKETMLGVPGELIAQHGAVSEPVARSMAQGVRARLGSDWGIAITGIAGPGGGTAEKPVGLVWIALAGPGGTQAWRQVFPGTREVVRLRATLAAMNRLRLELLGAR